MDSIGFAIVGCGAIARKHIASIVACKEAKLVAVCDISEERMKQAITLYRELSCDGSSILETKEYQDLLTKPQIQVVVISTLTGLHAEVAIQALRVNKHIMLEKPMALSLQDADAIIHAAKERGLYVQICHQLRYRPILREIKQLITQGALGRLSMGAVTLRLNRTAEYYQAVEWRGTWEMDGGMLLNQAIHVIDLLRWYLGIPVQVYCDLTSIHPYKETEDIAAAVVLFSGGVKGLVEANSITLPSNLEQSLCLIGDKGTLCLGGTSLNRIDRWHIEGKPQAIVDAKKLLKDTNEHVYMYQALVDAIGNKNPVHLIDASEGRLSLELIFAMYLSASKAENQLLPLTAFSTSMMKL